MKKKMQRLMGEIKRRMSHLRKDSEPDELHMRMCMGKTILLMKHLRETFVESAKCCELVRRDASTSLHKCRQHMVFLYRVVPCNDGGGKVNHEVRRGFHQVMDAVLLELGHFIRDSPKTQNSRKEEGLQHVNQNLMLLGDRAERGLKSELSKTQLKADLDASNNDGGDAIKQYSPKWSDLIMQLSGKMKKTHQSLRQNPDCEFMWRRPSESCLTDNSSFMDLRDSDNESPTCLSTESWQDTRDSCNNTQTRSTSSDSLFRSEEALTTSDSEMTFCDQLENTHQSLRQIPDWNVNCRQLSETCLNLTENREKSAHMNHKDPQPESKATGAYPIQTLSYQQFLAQIYKPIVRRGSISLDPSFLREMTPVSEAKQTSLPNTYIKPKRPPSTPSHFSLGKTFGDKRLRLLRWCKQRTRSYGLPMYEFSESWTSGRALVALMHSYHKDLVEHRFLSKESRQDTLTYGAELAKSLGVDCGVDIVQVCLQKKPDFCKVFQFVRELRRCLDHR